MGSWSIKRWFRDVSIAKKLYFTIGIMAVLILFELLTLWFAVNTLSSVRAYVSGEGLWSKAQKDAVFQLRKYAQSGDEADYQSYLDFIAVPLGDKKARTELEKPQPDMAVARQGFLEGRNHPDDIGGMIQVFRQFRNIYYIDRAIGIWAAADSQMVQLTNLGERLHAVIRADTALQYEINALAREISPINERLTVLEDEFSYTLGEGSRWLEGLILTILFAVALTVEVTGLLLTVQVGRSITRSLKDIIKTSEAIAAGDYTARTDATARDEIGLLARSFNEMAERLQQNISSLERQRALYESLLRAQSEMGEGVAITEGSRFIYVNDALIDIYGYTKEELMALPSFLDIVAPEERDAIANRLRERMAGNTNMADSGELTILHKSGRRIHIAYSLKVMGQGDRRQIFSIIRDITPDKIEEDLEKLAIAATKSFNSVIIADSTGRIEWVNEGFVRLTGYSIEEVKNTHGELLRKGRKTGLSQETDFHETVVKEKKPVTYESKNYTKQGKEYWVITTLTPVLGATGEVERIIAIDSDITVRKKMEEDLINANKIAEHSLMKGNKALDELLKAKRQVEESMKVKEQFLANMSHEIRTPMNAIVGFTDLILKTPMTAEQKQYVDAIKTSGENLIVIINDILDFSKLQSGKITFEQIGFRLSQVVSTLKDLMLPHAVDKRIRLATTIGEGTCDYLVGDPTRLNQVLINLVGNAIKFTENGEVRILVKQLEETADTVKLEFTVKDTGIGIPASKLGAIFEEFTQATSDTTRKYGGSGLGLTIVRQLVEMLGGKVSVESEVGKGSTFRFVLRFLKSSAAEVESNLYPEEESQAQVDDLEVLLVEDNPLNQVLARKVLSDWGWKVDMAENGKVAVDMIAAKMYDIVLMDIQLPEMDGYEATHFVRTKLPAPFCNTPIMAMTAHAISSEEQKSYEAGMQGYISKPFNQKTLYNRILAVLHKNTPMKHTDLSYLKQLSSGSNKFMAEMISIFIDQTPQAIESMEKYLQARDWPALRGVAHKMKPSVSFVGLKEIEGEVKLVEESAANCTGLDELPGRISKIRKVCSEAIEELKHDLAGYNGS